MYSAGHLPQIFNELLASEATYIKTLRLGIENFARILSDDNRNQLPVSLQGRRQTIFGLIEYIYRFHKNEFQPALQRCSNVREISEAFRNFTDRNRFYVYVMFAINKSKSNRLVEDNREFFVRRQEEVEDTLGVFSFLMQPIQRLPKYRLLLDEIIKEIMKSDFNMSNEMKLAMAACCIAQKSLNKVIEAANGAISLADIDYVDENRINISKLGIFLKTDVFKMKDYTTKRKYRGKLFLFEKSVIYTEYSSDSQLKLHYRGMYVDETIGLTRSQKNPTKQFRLFVGKVGNQDIRFTLVDANGSVDYWCDKVEAIMRIYREEVERKQHLLRISVENQNQIKNVMDAL